MGRKKLTLSAEEDVIRASRQLAKRSRASISEMFSRWVLSVSDASRGDAETEA